jgi:hypothetical protein
MRIAVILFALATAGVIGTFMAAGCGPVTSGAQGVSCTDQSDCINGLECLPIIQITDAGCQTLSSACQQKCTTDQDCVNSGADFTCLTECGGTPVCEPQMIFGDASFLLTDASAEAAAADAGSPVDAGGASDAQGQ